MYDQDPRAEWSASLAYHFPGCAGKRDDLMDLTPTLLRHLLDSHKEMTRPK